ARRLIHIWLRFSEPFVTLSHRMHELRSKLPFPMYLGLGCSTFSAGCSGLMLVAAFCGLMGSCGHFSINSQAVSPGEFIIRAGPVLLTGLVAGGFMAYALWQELPWARWFGAAYWLVVGLPLAALAWPDVAAAAWQAGLSVLA